MQTSSTAAGSGLPPFRNEDADYHRLLHHVAIAIKAGPLFTTAPSDALFDLFLAGIPMGRRQHYQCRTCRHFVERYGGLVVMDDEGFTRSAIWPWAEVAPFFSEAVLRVRETINRSRITGVFLSSEAILGLPENSSPKAPHPDGCWHHLAIHLPLGVRFRKTPLQDAHQAMAEKVQDFGTLSHGLADYPIDVVRKAYALLTTGGLFRSEKCIGVAKWLLELHEAREHAARPNRENLVWRAVATAPAGYCHVRSTMISTLLDDLVAGKDFSDIKRAFDEKMNPTQYQRPQAAPTAGQLAAAESVVAKLESAGSLQRRFATLDEILPKAIWLPKPPAREMVPGPVFGHLSPQSRRDRHPIAGPSQTMTWEKFRRTVLPTAEQIEFYVEPRRDSYFAFVTASDLLAPPILQWDSEDARNPVNWYFYSTGSFPHHWGIAPGCNVTVEAVTLQPSSWGAPFLHQSEGAFFILKGAKDMQHSGLALFPEVLRSEYHGIRAAIEAYSQAGRLAVPLAPLACGIAFQAGGKPLSKKFWVTAAGVKSTYTIDRWD